MTFFPYLTAFDVSLAHLALVAGAALILPFVIDRETSLHRVALFVVAWGLAIRYAHWRATETLAPLGLTWDWAASWSFFAFEMLALISSLSAFVIMSRVRVRHTEADENAEWWAPDPPPRVAVLIATYNEDQETLERTIIGTQVLDHDRLDMLVLDDGRRDWLAELCAARGVRHVTRPDNLGAKAGNINHALHLLEAEGPPDFIAVLDADFVPHRQFLTRTLALFHAPDVGLVQTPQHFFNADPIQHNLGLSRSYPDEQRFFFDHMQPARDGWGTAFCCGTSSVIRWPAVADVGGFPTESITEDFMLTLTLQDKGWRTVYLDEPLTEGLAPEGLKEYVAQRARWCLGLMQIARSRHGPLGDTALRLRDRWSVTDSVFYWLTSFAFRLAAVVYPLLYWFFNITVVDAEVPDVISYFGVYFLWILTVLNLLSRGMVVPILNEVSQLVAAIPVTRAAVVGLLRPKGHPFSVTAKGGDRSRIIVQWRLMMPFAVLLVLTLAGLLIGIVSDRFAYHDTGDGKAVILFWTLYNLVVLSVTVLACVELPRRERHVADAPERAIFAPEGGPPRRVWLASLTRDVVRIRGVPMEPGTRGIMQIRDVGDVPVTVFSREDDGARLHLFPEPTEHDALLRRFYTQGDAPSIRAAHFFSILHDAAWRLSFRRRGE
ncbi:glycosyltransferase [Roseovarius sp. SYSU LYC5161]|uniref:glycosyltransferase family 2 protein n=1 Tax=Roseovarius halophilus (ex Wu et al. 2025) TaxID=3376060 RepID=UPI0039997DCD